MCKAGEIGDVGRIFGRQAEGSHLIGKTEPAEVLHGARLCSIGLRVKGRGRFLVDEQDTDTAPSKFVREHQPERPATDDQH